MKRTRGNRTKYLESSDSENEIPPKRSSPEEKTTKNQEGDSSSSESDIESYLQKPEKLDLNSDFFNTKSTKEFENIEKNIFAGFTRLSDSESDEEPEQKPKAISEFSNDPSEPFQQNEAPTTKLNFNQLQDFTNKIEEAKKQVELYKARKHTQEKSMDVSNLLAAGEKKLNLENITAADLHSSDFESCDSEQEWEEIKSQEPKEKSLVPNKGLQIVVDMPEHVKKKKGVDLVAAMKRRLNRIRKENQVLIHRVHLLSYIAHGNYVNAAINDTNNMALALSLLPSEHCYPPSRTDLSYLEQIVAWYKRTIVNIEKPVPKKFALDKCLHDQIQSKQAYNKKMLALIFVIILRSLGIQTRLVMSLQVEPLRPPASDLHSVSSKETSKKSSTKKNSGPSNKKNVSIKNNKKSLSSVIDHDIPSTSGQNNKKKLSDVKISVQEPTPEKIAITSNSIASKLRTRTNSTKLAVEKKGRTKSLSTTIKTAKIDVEKPKRLSKSTESLSSVESQKATKARGKSVDNKKQKSENQNTKSTLNKSKSAETLVSNTNGKNKAKAIILKADTPSTRKRAKSTESLSSVESRKTTKAKGKSVENEKQKIKSTSNKSKSAETLISNTNAKSKPKTSTLKTGTPSTRKRAKSTESIDSLASNTSRKSTRISSQAKKIKNEEPEGKVLKIGTTTTARKLSKTSIASKSSDNKNQNTRGRGRKVISQLDGLYDSDSDVEMLILQVDGSNDDDKKGKKPNLKNLKPAKKVAASSAAKKTRAKPNLKSLVNKKSPPKTESESESEFEPANWSPINKRLEHAKPNLDKLKTIKTSKKDVKKDIIDLMKDRISKQKQIERSRLAKSSTQKSKSNPVDTDSDSDYAPEPIKKKHHESEDDFVPKTKVKKRVQVRPVLSENESDQKKKFGNDVWVEVFLEAEEKWISVDVVYGQVHCVKEIAQRSTHPLSYVLAWDNNNKVKDVTQRYCPNFNTVTRKLRIDQKWWMESLKPFMGISTARDKEEDEDLARLQLDQPLPKSISEYKNHPLYALKRHLLKFEAIYPPEPTTLGFIRGEAVYPRTCVYTLHSREIWLKQAKTVKLGEEPYKIVKARPKWDKLSNKAITDQLLEIFGPWQVQDYDPPTAENGVVPRNAFGNVDLFKSCMLPKGCVHLKLPGLNKIAKRMDIDCASAIIGFDFHGGWSHPVYDGFVVCKEFEDKLICAWELEQEELDRKEEEKIDKRVYGNWKKLIRGLLIRERLKARYDFGGEQSASTSAPKVNNKEKGPTFITKKSKRK